MNDDTTDNLLDLIAQHVTCSCGLTIDRDLFDSRDLIEARKEAEAIIEADDCSPELKLLLQSIIKGVTEIENEVGEEFAYGTSFIADSYFEEYAEQYADDIGAINKEQDWPLTCIDWKKAARELQLYYRKGETVEVEGANTDVNADCGAGVNVATLPWCMREWQPGFKILIVEFTKDDIACIPTTSDGKFRLHRCKVVGEKDLKEIGLVPEIETPQ